MNEPTEVSWAPGTRRTVTVTDIAFGGEGVARVEDFVVFVPFVLVGEVVEVEVTEVKPRFARARLVRVVTPSADRVEPACRYFGDCGGCQYQHMDYPVQLAVKRKQVADLFERVGGFAAAVVDPVIPCPQPYGYRNRIMVRSQWDKFKQGLNIGFIRHDNRLVVDLESCAIAEPVLNDQIQRVRANPPPKGGLKVALRVSPEGWEVPPDSFFQNNFHLLPALTAVLRERLREAGSRHLLDVYCGVGFFALELADAVEAYLGVEYDTQAIKAAHRNAVARGRANGQFVKGRAEELLPELVCRFPPDGTTVILDPPRVGCAPAMLPVLRKAAPAQILYVSCHPATLARDLKKLCDGGAYELRRVTPLDMFPQTQHVECVAELRRQTPPPTADAPIGMGSAPAPGAVAGASPARSPDQV